MRTPTTILAALLCLGLCAQQVDLHLPKPIQAKRYRTAAFVVAGFGLATGVPMLLSKEGNMNEVGRAWTAGTMLTSVGLMGCAFSVDLRLGKHPYKRKR